jgi:hypothetical protein
MGPSDIQEVFDFDPFTPVRLTLASGDVVELRQREGLTITGLTLSVADTNTHGQPRLRLVSVPNICLLEPISTASSEGGRLAAGGGT